MSEDIPDTGKIPKYYFDSCRSNFWDYFRLLQSRNRSKTCGRYVWWYIRPRKNSQKLFRVIFCIVWGYFPFWHARSRPKTSARYVWWYIRIGKISKSYSEPFKAYWETIFAYSTSETISPITDFIAECKPFEGKFEQIIPSHLKHIERLFLTITVQKWVDFVWKICLMIYRPRKKFQNYSEPFRANSEATLDYSTIESSQKM